MKRVSATITSKWQITLPKMIRDVLKVKTGDQIDFAIETNGQIIVGNKKIDEKSFSVYNLVGMLLENKRPITVTGRAATGKTTFVKDVVLELYKDFTVGVLEPREELSYTLKDDIQLVVFKTNIDNVEQILLRSNIDLLVIEEAHYLKDWNLVKTIREKGIPLIIVSQEFSEEQLAIIGDQYMIHANRDEAGKVEKIEKLTFDSERTNYIRLPIYKA